MKIFLSSVILFLFFIPNSFGQTETRLSQRDWYIDYGNDGDFIIRKSTIYSYFPSGKIKEETNHQYNQEGVFEQTKTNLYDYNNDGSLLLRITNRRYNSIVNLWVTEYWIDYTYDANGCEMKKEYTPNVGGLSSVFEFERDADCKITKETQWVRDVIADSLYISRITEFDYLPDGLSYEAQIFSVNYLSGATNLLRSRVSQYNADGLLEERLDINDLHLIDAWTGRKRSYAYDQYGNLTSQVESINSFSAPNWSFNFQYTYQNEYDSQGRWVRRISERQYESAGELITAGDSKTIKDFEYECEDWVAQETFAWAIAGIGNGSRYVNYYEGEDDCFEIEKIVLEIAVYPNPTSGNITINSPVFQSGNTKISVFDVSGKLLLEKNEIRREEKVDVDLSHLPNGMYVIQLMSQEYFVQEKIVVTK